MVVATMISWVSDKSGLTTLVTPIASLVQKNALLEATYLTISQGNHQPLLSYATNVDLRLLTSYSLLLLGIIVVYYFFFKPLNRVKVSCCYVCIFVFNYFIINIIYIFLLFNMLIFI